MSEHTSGFHAIEELLKAPPGAGGGRPEALLVSGKPGPRVRKLIELAQSRGIATVASNDAELSRLCGNPDHRGVVLRLQSAALRQSLSFDDELDALQARIQALQDAGTKPGAALWPLVLVLDSITDPHNLGAILRSADKFGVDLVVVPERRSAQENETVRKSSAGAAAWVKLVTVGNLSRAAESLREAGFWVVGADMDGTAAHEMDCNRALAIVMGSEGKGIGRLLGQHCDEMVSIPCTGHVDSLNVSVASAILVYEVRRQHGFSW